MTENNVRAIALHNPNDAWTQARLDLIRKTICHPSMSEPEIALFLEQCKRTGADPMLGEAYCVPRKVKQTTKDPRTGIETDEYVDRYVFQMGEEGMNVRCSRSPDYRGIRFAAFYEKDTLKIDGFSGEIVHVFEPNKDRGRLLGAWALVTREGYTFSPEILYLTEYEQRVKFGKNAGQLTSQWQKSVTMIVKCARAAARRRAYPEAFAGVYAQEEIQLEREAQAGEVAAQGSPAPADDKAPLARARNLRAKIDAKVEQLRAAAVKPEKKAEQLPAVTVLDNAPAPKATPSKATKSEVKKATDTITNSDMDRAGPPPVDEKSEPQRVEEDLEHDENDRKTAKLSFGDWRGKQISTLDTDTLIAAIAYAEDALAGKKVPDKWIERVKWESAQIEAELQKREAEQ